MTVNGTNGHTNGTNGHAASLPSLDQFLSKDYDFVIIGGGAAGLCVAARLTEDPNVSVAVLEAGKNKLNDMIVDTPAMHLQALGDPDYDWMLFSEPQGNFKDRVLHYPRGKALGGSTAINYMMYARGSDADFDDWAELAGDPEWNSNGLKKYFRKHQTLEPFDDSITERGTMPFVGENHGLEGPVRTGFNNFRLPIEDDIIKAADEATGLTKKPMDPWSGDHIGFYNTLGMVARNGPHKGKRSYAARGFFEPNQNRPNLAVLCEAFVEKIELNGKKAVGATFTHNGQQHTVKSKREVIVAGDALLTPQILELSGIGDPEILRAAGVEVKIENKGVGANFQDHVLTVGAYELTPGNISLDAIIDPQMMEQAQKMLKEQNSGPLTSICSTQGFLPVRWFMTDAELTETVESIRKTANGSTPFQKKQLEQIIRQLESDTSANLQLVAVPTACNTEDGWANQKSIFPTPTDPKKPHNISLAACCQYPVSRGTVHIKSSDPKEAPAIDPAFIKHPADVAVLAASQKMMNKMHQSKHLSSKIARRVFPPENMDMTDTAQAKAAVKEFVLSEYHPCGSVAMGDALDSHLRVKGAEGLRVIDASAFPNNVSGNICSAVYALAEKGADIVKADNGIKV
ncbi:alcohol oxidase [Pseudovirgaria hyperparasitica]|uniref:Alcohol oxidase n=1 Tax=Pseudovirgaria hyperparasitica TaxID=470096 RepID=A0A6A6WCT4_9PEZI|nr:alcohol oxidase [Pseudovirgaria hyperparasitica]KAF2760638.1 alcohol oxidase [Pseudovirgaria hyperparasitica]